MDTKQLETLKEQRKKLGLTQFEMAKKLEVSIITYRVWEHGVGKPNDENAKKLEKLLKAN